MIRVVATGIAVVLLAGGLAAAHEKSLHKGHPREGQVVSISKDGLVMQTTNGKVSVALSGSTVIERGDDKVAWDAVQTGDHVSVFGTTLATGELVAREIVIGGGGHHAE